jgi:hypothetical protein
VECNNVKKAVAMKKAGIILLGPGLGWIIRQLAIRLAGL